LKNAICDRFATDFGVRYEPAEVLAAAGAKQVIFNAIATRAGERLIPCSLELGGKDAMIVCADANLARAAKAAAWGAMFNSGQTCVSVERVYVVVDVYDEFVDLVTREISRLRHGIER